jgi:predicted Zn-dependent protease
MDIFYTVDEKYLQAVEEYRYGESPKCLQLLNEIMAAEPGYARAWYLAGQIYHQYLNDYQQAGYCFKTCNELDPLFPDVYGPYIKLLAFLDMDKHLNTVKQCALQTPGVDHATIWNMLGQYAERHLNLTEARNCYEKAYARATITKQMEEIESSLERIAVKQARKAAYQYSLS